MMRSFLLISFALLPATLRAQHLPTPSRFELTVNIAPAAESLSAVARISLKNRDSVAVTEAQFILYRMLRVHSVTSASGATLPFTQQVVSFVDRPLLQVNHIRVPLHPALRPGQTRTISIAYSGFLAGYVETGMLYVQDRIDTSYSLIRMDAYAYPEARIPSSSFNRRLGLPTYDYEIRATAPAAYTVANLGRLVSREMHGDSATWVYRNIRPAWRMDIAVAKFGMLSDTGLRVFYLPGDSVGAARVLTNARRSMALFTRWFGPLEGNPSFSVLEIPNGWGSQADVSGILQAAAAFHDSTRSNELYHEVSHLWNPPNTERPAPRIEEGLATFLEYLAKDSLERPGVADSTEQVYWRWIAKRVAADSQMRRVPMIDYGAHGMTDYSYSVGMLMFAGLHHLIGQQAFDRIIGRYYAEHHRTSGSARDLVAIAEQESQMNLAPFFNDWLFTTHWTDRLSADSTFAAAMSRYH